jgi:hypothetical protein
VTHRALVGCDGLDGARVDDAQEEHGEVEGAQDVGHVLDALPAQRATRKFKPQRALRRGLTPCHSRASTTKPSSLTIDESNGQTWKNARNSHGIFARLTTSWNACLSIWSRQPEYAAAEKI